MKRNILFLIDTLEIGGAERSLLQIIPKLKHFNGIVCSIYLGNALRNEFIERGVKVYSLEINDRFAFNHAVKKIQNILIQENISLIHTSLYRADMIGRLLKKRYGVPLINSFVNNSYSKDRYRLSGLFTKIKLFYYQLRDLYTARIVDSFISNSNAIKITNSKALAISKDKIKVIYRGRDIDKYYRNDRSFIAEYHSKMALDSSFVFLNISRILPRKGQADIIMAFHHSFQLRTKAKLLIVGDGEYRKELESLVNEHQLQNQIIFLGNRNDIPELLNTADAFVFPSYYEGLPGALIEAMLAKKIIIASAIPENLECVHEGTSLLFEKGDITALAHQMELVLLHKMDYQHLAAKAQQEARQKFDIDLIVSQYEEVYKQLLGVV